MDPHVAVVLKKFLELQIAQNSAILDVAEKRQLLQGWNDGMERSMHLRDWHRTSWDNYFALKQKKQYEREVQEAVERFEANQKRLEELKDELPFSHIAS